MSQINIRNLSNENDDGSPEIIGISTFSATSFFVPPKGTTADRPSDCEPGSIRFNTDTSNLEYFRGKTLGWSQFELVTPNLGGGTGSNTGVGARGLFMNGFNASAQQTNTIDFVTISSLGNSEDFGDSTIKTFGDASCASRTRSFLLGGSMAAGQSKEISTNVFASLGNATDFGDLTDNNYGNRGLADSTRGVSMGGEGPSSSAGLNMMEYFTMGSTGSAVDFGDMSNKKIGVFTSASSTRGVIGGGRIAAPETAALYNGIEFITISSTGNSTDFGDLTTATSGNNSGVSGNSTRGMIVGGYDYPAVAPSIGYFNNIQFITIATLGNSQDFGDLLAGRSGGANCTSPTRAIVGNGLTPSMTNSIETFIITTAGNSVDFGDTTEARRTSTGASNAHGGL